MGILKNAAEKVKESAWNKTKAGASKVATTLGGLLKSLGKKALVVGGIGLGASVVYELYKDMDPFHTTHKIIAEDNSVSDSLPQLDSSSTDTDSPDF